MAILDYVNKDRKRIYYIVEWTNLEITRSPHNDICFTDKDRAYKLCDELNEGCGCDSCVEYEVYDMFLKDG